MNKADITIGHIDNFTNLDKAEKAIFDPVKHFGYNLTANERSYCIAYARALFALRAERGEYTCLEYRK